MRKIMTLMVFGLFLISMAGVVSAKTVVAGIVYDEEGLPFDGADVLVSCDHNSTINNQSAASQSDGSYAVEYDEDDCNTGDNVNVTATTDTGYGDGSGVVISKTSYPGVDINLAIINVPTVPEFGLFMGILTLISAVGIFAFVRRD